MGAGLVVVCARERRRHADTASNAPGFLPRCPVRDNEHPGRNDSESATGGHMMRADTHQKVNACHLKRNAYLYVRQSTIRQVLENTESTKRQYALRQRAIALGWA